ncbi:MAG: anthranilate synthase component I family protein, partial [Bacteroidales bacterium]|nr:anthranilate synthase component I family protein [Bacteroidales bacterium]
MYTYKTKSKTILGDMHTPVSAYMRLRDIGIQSALMESNDYHGNDNSRSFIGISPIASFSVEHGTAVFKMPGDITRKPITANYRVETALSEFLANFEVKGDDAKYCGLYGYTSFNAVRYFEDIPVEDTYAENNDAPD